VLTNDPILARARARLPEPWSRAGRGAPSARSAPLVLRDPVAGLNYRLTDLQCASVGASSPSSSGSSRAGGRIVARYRAALADLPTIELPEEAASVRAAWHLCAVRLRGLDRRAFCAGLRRLGVGTQVHYIPVNAFPLYRGSDTTPRPRRWRRPPPTGWSACRSTRR
jgi:dTDP-4-amino-4,6-dideoxygalactose transaminase